MKKLIVAALAAILMVTCLTVSVFAAGVTATGTAVSEAHIGDSVTVTFDITTVTYDAFKAVLEWDKTALELNSVNYVEANFSPEINQEKGIVTGATTSGKTCEGAFIEATFVVLATAKPGTTYTVGMALDLYLGDDVVENTVNPGTVEVVCLNHNLQPVEGSEIPATCENPGKYADLQCTECGAIEEGAEYYADHTPDGVVNKEFSNSTYHYETCTVCGEKVNETAHTPNVDEATTETAKYCTVCDYVLEAKIDHVHAGNFVSGYLPTCTQSGRIVYYACDCGMRFWDKACEDLIDNYTDLILKKYGHSYTSGKYEVTDEGHSEKCIRCDVYGKVEAHSGEECECGYTAEHKHTLVKVEAKDATCTADGNLEYYYCTAEGCDWMQTAEGMATNIKNVTVPAGHKLEKVEAKAATCTENGNNEYYLCSVCKEYAEKTLGGVATNPKNETIPAAHDLVKVEAKEATCAADGNIAYYYCTKCDWMQTEAGMATNAKAVVLTKDHELVAVAAKEATCAVDGNIAYSYCKNCDYMVTEAGMNTNAKAVILTKDHDLVKVDYKAPTATENGNIAYSYCKNCDYMVTEAGMNTNAKAVILPATGEPATTDPTPGTTEPDESKPTGDNGTIFFVVVIVAVAALGASALSFKKRED